MCIKPHSDLNSTPLISLAHVSPYNKFIQQSKHLHGLHLPTHQQNFLLEAFPSTQTSCAIQTPIAAVPLHNILGSFLGHYLFPCECTGQTLSCGPHAIWQGHQCSVGFDAISQDSSSGREEDRYLHWEAASNKLSVISSFSLDVSQLLTFVAYLS